MPPSAAHLHLLACHIDAAFGHDARQRIRWLNDGWRSEPPRLWIGWIDGALRWRLRADVPDGIAARIAERCRAELPPGRSRRRPAFAADYRALLSGCGQVSDERAGPIGVIDAGRPSTHAPGTVDPVRITLANAGRLRQGLAGWIGAVPHQQPMVAVCAACLNRVDGTDGTDGTDATDGSDGVDGLDGAALSICASVRMSAAAHAAGVETVPAARGQGHAAHAVAAWARAVHADGRIALFTTTWDNASAHRLAARAGVRMFGAQWQLR